MDHMGVSTNGGTPIAGWFIRENPIKMDEDWGYPHFRKPPYGCDMLLSPLSMFVCWESLIVKLQKVDNEPQRHHLPARHSTSMVYCSLEAPFGCEILLAILLQVWYLKNGRKTHCTQPIPIDFT